MERQLFNWDDGWDGDQECITYYNVELVVPIGSFKKGERFFSAIIDFNNSDLQLFRYKFTGASDVSKKLELVGEFKLKLSVV